MGITYGDLNDVGSNEVHVLEAANDGAQLASAPAAGLGCARRRSDFKSVSSVLQNEAQRGLTSRVESVDVKREVNGVLGTNAVNDALDDTLGTNCVNLSRLHDLKATVTVVIVVARSGKGRANASVDVGVVSQETLHSSMVEVSACRC